VGLVRKGSLYVPVPGTRVKKKVKYFKEFYTI
jgi:hypothetical protein